MNLPAWLNETPVLGDSSWKEHLWTFDKRTEEEKHGRTYNLTASSGCAKHALLFTFQDLKRIGRSQKMFFFHW